VAGSLTLKAGCLGTAPPAAMPSDEVEAAFACVLDGRRFDNPAAERDGIALRRINTVDPIDFHED